MKTLWVVLLATVSTGACADGKCPRVLRILRSRVLMLSMALVV